MSWLQRCWNSAAPELARYTLIGGFQERLPIAGVSHGPKVNLLIVGAWHPKHSTGEYEANPAVCT